MYLTVGAAPCPLLLEILQLPISFGWSQLFWYSFLFTLSWWLLAGFGGSTPTKGKMCGAYHFPPLANKLSKMGIIRFLHQPGKVRLGESVDSSFPSQACPGSFHDTAIHDNMLRSLGDSTGRASRVDVLPMITQFPAEPSVPRQDL